MKIQGSVILITGASSGIGLAIARALAAEGARVALAARSFERLREEAARLGEAAFAVPLDVTDPASVNAAIAAVVARFGRIDAVINNAGNGGNVALWAGTAPDVTEGMFAVHVLGAERVMRAVLPVMRAQGAGTIVNIASTVAWVPMPGAAAYSAAKAAVVGLSEALRAELAPEGIDVLVFAPPHTSTDAGKSWPLDLPKIFEPDWVAAQMVAALRKDRRLSVPGGNAILLFLKRISPRLAGRIMERIGFGTVARARALLAAP